MPLVRDKEKETGGTGAPGAPTAQRPLRWWEWLGPRPPKSSRAASALSGLERISRAREGQRQAAETATPEPVQSGSAHSEALRRLEGIHHTREASTPEPPPISSTQRYMPGLDGLRALAVLAVVAYHLGIGWAPAGLLGVGVFFTLSGYLITDLLLAQWETRGRLGLSNFWLRRARRLLPALFAMLALVVIWVALFDRSMLGALWSNVAAAGLYVSNWWAVIQHVSYFSRFGPPSPLGHLWSLAIEEQFYIVWPWLLWLGLRYVRERRGAVTGHARLASLTLAAAGISALAMAVLYQPGVDPTRVYDGTDTRAFGLLFGAALAMVWPSRRLTADSFPSARRLLNAAGVGGLVVIALLIWGTTEYSPFLYRGGMVLLSIATMMTIAALVHPGTRLGHALGREPLRWIGVRSYAIYLWQFPVITLTTPMSQSSVNPLRAILQVAAIIGLSALSWIYIERPVRQGALGRLWARVKAGELREIWGQIRMPNRMAIPSWSDIRSRFSIPSPSDIRSRFSIPTRIGVSGRLDFRAWRPRDMARRRVVAGFAVVALLGVVSVGVWGATGSAKRAITPPHAAQGAAKGVSTAPPPAAPPTPPPTTTSCQSVVHIGDSTSEGLTSTTYLPDPTQRIDAQYARVGATSFDAEISGARSIVERYKNEPNAEDVAKRLMGQGFHGCWVLALGTNEAADVAVGSSVGLSERVDRMMADVGNEPVLWVNVKSLLGSGPYAESHMADWDSALVDACSKYPNMRIFDWASVVQDSWFINDGIHFTTEGYAARSRMIADALVKAFPAGGARSSGCVLR